MHELGHLSWEALLFRERPSDRHTNCDDAEERCSTGERFGKNTHSVEAGAKYRLLMLDCAAQASEVCNCKFALATKPSG